MSIGINSIATTPVGTAPGTGTIKTISLTFKLRGGAAAANLNNINWAWFDQSNPSLFTNPTDKGSGVTTNASGVATITLTNSYLTSGQVGWLIITDSDGLPQTSHKAFSGPVAIP